MLEGDAITQSKRLVYDPQNTGKPVHFHENGSQADEITLVLNNSEAKALSGMEFGDAETMAQYLVDSGAAHIVVIKQGPLGALVHDGKLATHIPAYRSDRVWKIGSGDNFAAHFAFRWMTENRTPQDSADLASQATAYYCNTKGFATPDQLAASKPEPIITSKQYREGYHPKVYLAGPFFTLGELWMVEQARQNLEEMGLSVFSPYHDVGYGLASEVVEKDLDAIDNSDLIFAIADGLDAGTVYEIGYARAKMKPVIMYSENVSVGDRKMMEGSDCELCNDYVSAIYRALWAAIQL